MGRRALSSSVVAALLFSLTLITHFPFCHCQSYVFDNFPIPASQQATSVIRFFAYVPSDPPPLSIHTHPIGLSPGELLSIPLFGYNVTKDSSQRLLQIDEPQEVEGDESEAEPEQPEADDDSDTAVKQPAKGSWEEFFASLSPAEGVPEPDRSSVTEVVYDDVRLIAPDSSDLQGAIQLSVIRADDFYNLFYSNKPRNFCCDEKEYAAKRCSRMYHLIVPADVAFFKTVTLHPSDLLSGKRLFGLGLTTSDMYVLMLSNCGPPSNPTATVSGGIYLHNYFGYLPGIDAPKCSLYIILAAFYVLLLLVFGISLIRHRSQLIHIHTAIAVVLLVCLAETLMWFGFYRHRNLFPFRNNILFGAAILTTVIKNVLAFTLVLVASMGWGVTKPHLKTATKRKIWLVIVSYIIFDTTRQIVTQLRFSHQLSFLIVILCVTPVALLHGLIFFWIFSLLGELIEELKSKRQEIKLALFLRFWTVLIFTIIAAVAFIGVEVFVMSQDDPNSWKRNWIFTDVAPNSVFIIVLNTMIVLWAPSRNSKAMAYSSELPDEDSSRHLDTHVLGRDSGTREPTRIDRRRLSEDEDPEHSKIEMGSPDSETQTFKVFGKSQPLKDLDYDEDEA